MRNLVILGMHRSGTSMVAGALASAGVYAGRAEELLEDQADNPHGFWERRDVVDFDEASLAACGGSWFQPPASIEALARARSADVGAILARLPAQHSWLLKDPRMAITWPLWEASLTEAVVLYVYRGPLAVAGSLQRRNGFPLSLGLALWEYYNQCALDALGDRQAVCVAYEAIAADPQEALRALLGQLADLGVACEREPDVAAFDTSLGQSGPPEASAACLLSPSQRALAQYCEALCRAQTPPPRPAMSTDLWPRLQDLAGALAPLAQVHETRIALEERTEERDRSLATLRELETDHRQLAAAYQDEVVRHEQSDAEMARLRSKLEKVFVELSHAYGKLLEFEQSFLARIWRVVAKGYKLASLRRGLSTGYEDVLADARGHFARHSLPVPQPARVQRPAGKVSLLRNVAGYVLRNPAGSVRSFSLSRLKRAAAVFMTSSPEDLGVWIDSRFPERQGAAAIGADYELDESLDDLRLVFPVVESPRVSIVVPVYNEYRVTMRCLRSVLDNSGDLPYELIIADDCSSDLTASIGERVDNITVVRAGQNQGFLANCNAAAARARGDYILLLNNDTAVCPHWLDTLVDTMERDATIGIAGSKLLFPDGRLQEAGGIMWRDASAWNYGRMDDPEKPAYNYVKEVDFVSGACLLIRAALWRELQGFDARYRPAYYEDADLAFEARAAGYRVVFQPLSRVFHFEGVSNGTDLGSGIKQYQVRNQEKFREKWQRELDAFHFPNATHVFQARDRSRRRRSVLFIDHYVPHYDKDAGSRSTFMYVQLMLEMGYRVLFLGANYFPHRPYTQALQQLGVEVLVGEHMARHQDRWLQENARYIDNIYLNRPHVAEQFLSSLDKMKPRPQVIFFGCDLHYLRISREYRLLGDEQLRKDADRWRRREFAVFDAVDKIYYPSQVEVDEINSRRSGLDIRAIPLYALDDSQEPAYEFAGASDILFVGGFNHPPNVDAICWFVREILPLVSAGCPGIRLHVVGSNPTEAVAALQNDQVVVYGYLSDEELAGLYRRVRLAVVPLRFGAGIKGKVLEAIQKNVPLVTTRVGAEGIPEPEEVMNIADTVEDFAAQVIVVYTGDAQALGKLDAYAQWLHRNFSKQNAASIIREDFGEPLREEPVP